MCNDPSCLCDAHIDPGKICDVRWTYYHRMTNLIYRHIRTCCHIICSSSTIRRSFAFCPSVTRASKLSLARSDQLCHCEVCSHSTTHIQLSSIMEFGFTSHGNHANDPEIDYILEGTEQDYHFARSGVNHQFLKLDGLTLAGNTVNFTIGQAFTARLEITREGRIQHRCNCHMYVAHNACEVGYCSMYCL